MKNKTQKRVGSPASFRGVRGVYLTNMIMYVGGGLFFVLLLLILPLPMTIRLVLIVVAIVFLVSKYNALKALSKGDLNKSLKENCRRSIIIKPK